MTDGPRKHPRTRATPESQPERRLTAAIARAQTGDEQAFIEVYRAIQPRLLNYLRATVGETDAEDVAAETWISITGNLHTFRGDAGAFYAWSATIARRRAIDHQRKTRPADPVPLEQIPDRPAVLDTVALAEEALSTAQALALIRQLPPDQAQAVLLRVIMGLDTAATARILGKRPGAVRAATHRALRTLGTPPQPADGPTSAAAAVTTDLPQRHTAASPLRFAT